jgi:putative transposase
MAEATSIGIDGGLVQRLFTDPRRLLEVLKAVCQAAMAAEVAGHVGAGPHERSEARRGHRNGTKPRRLKTRVGELELDVPQVRGCEHGPYHPSLFNKWQRSERALLVACAEMYFQGVSTRNVREVLGAMCEGGGGGGGEVSAMAVSRVAQELDEKLASFRSRRLDEHAYPYVKVDARYEHVRVDGRVVSQAVLVAAGYTEKGRREVLDWRVGDSESEGCWGECLRSLKDRGLGGVSLVVSDAHRGLRAALQRHFQGAGWQRCQVHFKRELLRKVPKKKTAELMRDVAAVFAGHDAAECLRRGEEAAAKWEASYPAVAKMLREGLGDCLTVMAPQVPPDHRRRLNSTNMLESLMKRLRKRTAVVGVFPGRSSCDRLIGAQLLEVHERWLSEPVATFNMELVPAAADRAD